MGFIKCKLLFVLLAVLIACNQDTANTEVSTTENGVDSSGKENTSIEASPPLDIFCYRKTSQRDTILLKLKKAGNKFLGTLAFDNYQMDSSSGTVEGTAKGDTLILWYDFVAEGTHTIMEIVFKKQGNKLIRATGSIKTNGDSAYFENHAKLSFDTSQTLIQIDCSSY